MGALNILLVDDDQNLVTTLSHGLRKAMVKAISVTVCLGGPEALSMLAWLYEQLGLFERAADVFGQPTLFHGLFGTDSAQRLHRALDTDGPAGYWRERLALLVDADARLKQAGDAHRCPTYAYAIVYGKMGNLDAVCAALERAVAERAGHAVFMQAEPGFDALRGDPKFESLFPR